MDMMSKNPLEARTMSPMQSIADLAQSAISVAKATRSPVRERSPFVAQFGHCDAHGQYPVNVQDGQGQTRWFAEGCPHCRGQQNAARLLASCNIPKRFVDCDFENYQVDTDGQRRVLGRCEVYARDFARFRDAGACLLLCGRPGTGKNHLATAIGKRLLGDGYTVLRVKASQYLDAYWSKSFEERESWIKGMAAVDLLMIDEVGRSSNAKSAQDAFFRLLDARYEAQLPCLVATNLNRDELIEVLGDATYDRLTEGGSVRLTFDWESYRAKKGLAA